MIRVNLAPQQGKKAKRAGGRTLPSIKLPSFSAGASKWLTFALLAWVAAPAAGAYMHLMGTREVRALEESVRVARDDSARLAAIHAASAALRARADTIRAKVEVINGIDHGRYVWAHVVDEISRALPEHMWLTELVFLASDSPLESPRFVLNGRTGSAFALSEMMERLAASPFLTGVTLVQTTRVTEGDIRVYAFAVEAQYRQPEGGTVEMRPVFAVEGEE
jgi:Tfp pilus assembly protein PilN